LIASVGRVADSEAHRAVQLVVVDLAGRQPAGWEVSLLGVSRPLRARAVGTIENSCRSSPSEV
jgi:hypothetical protein